MILLNEANNIKGDPGKKRSECRSDLQFYAVVSQDTLAKLLSQ